ncbi:NfeD family protein [Parasphingorhabdus pacifica]
MVSVLWLIAAVVLITAETVSGDFVLVMLGAGALAAAGASALGVPLGLDAVVFGVLSLGLILLARPALKRRLQTGRDLKTNVEALPGKNAVVEATVDAHGGRIRIEGQVWSARALDETQVIEAGQTVTVVEISGATAVVWAGP